MWCWSEGAGWWIISGGIFILLFWGTVVALVMWGISKLRYRGDASPSSNEKHTPLSIAMERYAKGDISHEEFEQIRKNVSQFGGDK